MNEARPPQPDSSRYILLFESIHHVLEAETLFQQHSLWCDLVPVPRDLSADCGMALEFRAEDLGQVRALVNGNELQFRKAFRPVADGHDDVTELLLGTATEKPAG